MTIPHLDPDYQPHQNLRRMSRYLLRLDAHYGSYQTKLKLKKTAKENGGQVSTSIILIQTNHKNSHETAKSVVGNVYCKTCISALKLSIIVLLGVCVTSPICEKRI